MNSIFHYAHPSINDHEIKGGKGPFNLSRVHTISRSYPNYRVSLKRGYYAQFLYERLKAEWL